MSVQQLQNSVRPDEACTARDQDGPVGATISVRHRAHPESQIFIVSFGTAFMNGVKRVNGTSYAGAIYKCVVQCRINLVVMKRQLPRCTNTRGVRFMPIQDSKPIPLMVTQRHYRRNS